MMNIEYLIMNNTKQKIPSCDRIFVLVGVTGLEPAASRPPDVCATSCATPRYSTMNIIADFDGDVNSLLNFFSKNNFIDNFYIFAFQLIL